MEYSKIKSVEVVNFMGYRHATMNFDSQDIINLKGYNGAGKSTMLRAVAVALMNMFPRDQIDFIKHGERYFRIAVTFDDGVVIIRDKYDNGQSLYEMYKGEELLFTTKQGDKLSKVDDVPLEIKNYLGLIQTELGYLNYQTREDPLYLAETKGSENYYSLHEVLKTEELARANALLNTDKNELNSEITELESKLAFNQMSLTKYGNTTETLVMTLSEKEAEVQALLGKQKSISDIQDLVIQISNLIEIPKLEGIKDSRLNSILSIQNTFNKFSSMVPLPKVSTLERIDRLEAISRLQKTISSLDSLNLNLASISLEGIDIDRYPQLAKIQKLVKSLGEIDSSLDTINQERTSIENQRSSLVEEASMHGIRFKQCPNCGTLVEVNIDE